MKHFSPSDRERVVAVYRRSGLTLAAFAARIGLSVDALRHWIYRPRRLDWAKPMRRVWSPHVL